MDQLDTEDLKAVLRGDDQTAAAFLRLVSHPADVVEALRVVEPEEWPALLRLLPEAEARADVVAHFDEGERDALFALLPKEEIGGLISEMDSDDAADVVGELEPDAAADALSRLPAEDRAAVEQLLSYPEDSAGGIMQTERADVNIGATVREAIVKVREFAEEGTEIHRIYVVDDDQRLVGSVKPVDLVLNAEGIQIADIIEPPVATVTPLVDQEEVAHLFSKYDLVALPVVDDEGVLLGRIVFDDVVDVLAEEAEEDALLAAGTAAEELLYRDQATRIAMVRLPWIGVNLLGSLMSAYLLSLYAVVLEQAVLIASFIPVITAMGGNVGTQSATVLTRDLAIRRLDRDDLGRTLFREFRVGLLMGLLCGSGVGLIAAFVFGGGTIYLGLVVFLAMVSAMTAAAVVGAVAPAAMKRYGTDPAIASGPFVTTTNDIIGIVIYMSTAVLFLDKLAA